MRFGGELIHQGHDAHGSIQIVQSHTLRSMHFGTSARQSTMQISRPSRLVLPYTRSLLAGLLFNPNPRSALLLGLGGGSLPRFLRHYFPDCRLHVVELRGLVIELARRFFSIPAEDDLLQITHDDAAGFVSHCCRREGGYDLLIIDIDAPDIIGNPEFLFACRQHLSGNGIVTLNIWNRHHPATGQLLETIGQLFGNRMRLLPVDNGTNLIAVAANTLFSTWLSPSLSERAAQLAHHCGVEFPNMLQTLDMHSPQAERPQSW